MSSFSLPRWSFALIVACVVNALVFVGIPLLSGKVSSPPPRLETGGVFLTRFEPPEPPVRHTPKSVEKRAPAVPPPSLGRKAPSVTPPQVALMPELRMRLSGDISMDVALAELPGPRMVDRSEFDLGEVDTAPVSVRRDAPVYPMIARRNAVEGVVTVRFLVGEDGVPRKMSIVAAEPEGVFDRNVLRAVARWRFRPGTVDGRAVATWMRLPIRFRLGDE